MLLGILGCCATLADRGPAPLPAPLPMEIPVAEPARAPDQPPATAADEPEDQTIAHVSHATKRGNKVAARKLEVPMPVGWKRELRTQQWADDNDLCTNDAAVVEEDGPDGSQIKKYVFYAHRGPPEDTTVADFRKEGTVVSGKRITKRPDPP